MKIFHCGCGQRIFFDSTRCVQCGGELGFDPIALQMLRLRDAPNGSRFCANHARYDACNWLVPADDATEFCLACRLNDVIPNLEQSRNGILWARLERAKRRLIYTLLSLGLPVQSAPDANGAHSGGLRFRFLEDQRRNPDVFEAFVSTGHVAGTITINLAEADDAQRHAVREQMQERYRTLLGHFRHESGHYFFDSLVVQAGELAGFRARFGDESQPYEPALETYYRDGPPAEWSAQFVSAYATAHPHEDWAETFAHYLHIVDALETAEAAGLARLQAGEHAGWIREWIQLSVTLNELNRSLGLDDPYPFVLTDPVIAKLEFTDRLVRS